MFEGWQLCNRIMQASAMATLLSAVVWIDLFTPSICIESCIVTYRPRKRAGRGDDDSDDDRPRKKKGKGKKAPEPDEGLSAKQRGKIRSKAVISSSEDSDSDGGGKRSRKKGRWVTAQKRVWFQYLNWCLIIRCCKYLSCKIRNFDTWEISR